MSSTAEALARLPSRLYRRRRRLALILRETAGRVARWAALAFGVLVLLAGVVLTPLPGHVGLPLLVVGLMIVLRNSFQAKRRFLRWQRRHPKLIFPIRRLMRRGPRSCWWPGSSCCGPRSCSCARRPGEVLKRGRKYLRRRWLNKRPT